MDFKNEILMMSEEEVRNRAKELLNESQEDLITKYMFLEQQCKKQKEVIDKINNYIDNYDIFKVFSFPLMKRWEEEQVKSSIDYEFKTSLIKDLKEILEDKEVSE